MEETTPAVFRRMSHNQGKPPSPPPLTPPLYNISSQVKCGGAGYIVCQGMMCYSGPAAHEADYDEFRALLGAKYTQPRKYLRKLGRHDGRPPRPSQRNTVIVDLVMNCRTICDAHEGRKWNLELKLLLYSWRKTVPHISGRQIWSLKPKPSQTCTGACGV